MAMVGPDVVWEDHIFWEHTQKKWQVSNIFKLNSQTLRENLSSKWGRYTNWNMQESQLMI